MDPTWLENRAEACKQSSNWKLGGRETAGRVYNLLHVTFSEETVMPQEEKHFWESAFSTLGIRKWNSLPTTLCTSDLDPSPWRSKCGSRSINPAHFD